MGDGRDIDAVLEASLTELLTEFAATDKQLSTLRTGAWQQRQREDSDALLYIANHLHEARLRLQSAIVNRSASELVRQKRTPAPVEVVEKPKKVEPLRPATAPATVELKPVPSPRFTKRRLLVAAAIVLAAMSGLIMSFSSSSPASMIGVDKEVSKLDTRELPNGHLLADARQRRNVLIGVVSPAWAQLPSHQKRDELQTLLKYGKDKGIGSIMLIDKLGMPAGSASEQQISIEDLETTP